MRSLEMSSGGFTIEVMVHWVKFSWLLLGDGKKEGSRKTMNNGDMVWLMDEVICSWFKMREIKGDVSMKNGLSGDGRRFTSSRREREGIRMVLVCMYKVSRL